MLSKCIAAESEINSDRLRVLSINPGPINTEMQKRIRTADAAKIPVTKKFETLFSENKLQEPNDVAHKLFQVLSENNFSNGDFIDFNSIN